ncbi:MAG: hypothetical protein R2941_23560 [Desulfobacterales bacterium]
MCADIGRDRVGDFMVFKVFGHDDGLVYAGTGQAGEVSFIQTGL